MVVFDDDDYLAHYGILRKSGRYPYGSGGTDASEAGDFQKALAVLRKGDPTTGVKPMSEAQIAKSFGMTTTELRANIAIAGIIKKQDDISTAAKLKATGMSNEAIGREMGGKNESSVRALLAPSAKDKSDILEGTANLLRDRVDQDHYIDVGKGNEHHLNIAKTKLDTAIAMLKTEGYTTHTVMVPQATTGHDTRVRVLCKPGTTWSEVNGNREMIRGVKAFSDDGGRTFHLVQEPLKVNPSRIDVKYGPEGGAHADGVIYVRPGVKDLSLDGASYAQVRIAVGDKHYLKGMAVMKDGLPDGVDLQFNTNKSRTSNKLDAMKSVVHDSAPIERFGAFYRQLTHPVTGKVTSALNIVNDEHDWNDWSKTLASQMLSKQKPDFVERQLNVTYANKKAQLDEILSLTNPVVKKKLLESYADDMDASSVHLKAAALPRQKTHVILPINTLKDHEVYAPGYKNGESVVLIRYPHGGKFEIPELTVNNGNAQGKKIIGPGAKAAIGINSKVANRLSGADFDGDTVVVIPNDRKRVKSESPLKDLKGFDPQSHYPGVPGVTKVMRNTQTEMGKISNLITDMTIGGANHAELARAVKHSMVVIDAEKHGLDYTRSAKDNGIGALKKKYQPGRYAGASTIISRIGGEVSITQVKKRSASEGGPIDKKTGEVVYVPSGKTRPKAVVDPKTGETTWVKEAKTERVAKGTRLPGTNVKDAYDLVSGVNGTPIERHYAEYSNKVRGLANQARKVMVNTPDPHISPSAKRVYKGEVASLKAKLKEAQSNSPRERQAQLAANQIIRMKREAEPHMTAEQRKRVASNAIKTTRERLGAKPVRIEITPKEWQAIQSNAVAANVLKEILTKADMETVKQMATPQAKVLMQPHNVSRAQALAANGYTRAEIADELGVSVSTLDRALA